MIRARAYPPRQPGRMNKTEAAYAEHLELRRLAGEIISWRFEEIGLRLANGCFYYPDFEVILPDGGIEIHDVKGRRRKKHGGVVVEKIHVEDDALVKLKVAAAMFSEFRFFAVSRRRNGPWEFEEYKP